MRKKSVDFFNMWKDFFKVVNDNLPRDEKRNPKKLTKSGGGPGGQA